MTNYRKNHKQNVIVKVFNTREKAEQFVTEKVNEIYQQLVEEKINYHIKNDEVCCNFHRECEKKLTDEFDKKIEQYRQECKLSKKLFERQKKIEALDEIINVQFENEEQQQKAEKYYDEEYDIINNLYTLYATEFNQLRDQKIKLLKQEFNQRRVQLRDENQNKCTFFVHANTFTEAKVLASKTWDDEFYDSECLAISEIRIEQQVLQ